MGRIIRTNQRPVTSVLPHANNPNIAIPGGQAKHGHPTGTYEQTLVDFDPASGGDIWMQGDGPAVGPDNHQFTIVLTIKPRTLTPVFGRILRLDALGSHIFHNTQFNANGTITIAVRDLAGADVHFKSSGLVTLNTRMVVMYSVDSTPGTEIAKYWFAIEGVGYADQLGGTTASSNMIGFSGINRRSLGADPTGVNPVSSACIGDVWARSGTYFDFDDPAERAKFTDPNTYAPISLGPTGLKPDGQLPSIFFGDSMPIGTSNTDPGSWNAGEHRGAIQDFNTSFGTDLAVRCA